jgi:LacI family transcriptional regulator
MAIPPTIADIARLAGVGTATVDRVLNRRPGVNAETVLKVMQVQAQLGASPQLGRPRRSENFRFAFVLPGESTPFFDLVERQIAQSAGDFRHQHITEVTHRLDAKDPAHFAAALADLRDCQGIALLAPDLPPVKLAINELVRAGVHVVTLLSDVAGSMRETYIGADNRAAGRTAGLLLARMAQTSKRNTLLLASQATRMSAEIERRIGFAQVLEERFPKLRMQRSTLPESLAFTTSGLVALESSKPLDNWKRPQLASSSMISPTSTVPFLERGHSHTCYTKTFIIAFSQLHAFCVACAKTYVARSMSCSHASRS